jgi:hypothetical protein
VVAVIVVAVVVAERDPVQLAGRPVATGGSFEAAFGRTAVMNDVSGCVGAPSVPLCTGTDRYPALM